MATARPRLVHAADKRQRSERILPRHLTPRKVASWAYAVDLAALDQSGKPLPPVVRWRNAVLGPDGPRNPITRLVLMVLSHHMDKYGQCFPSLALIARESRCSPRSVADHMLVAKLECWIEVTEAQGYGKGWKRHEYIACVPSFKAGDA